MFGRSSALIGLLAGVMFTHDAAAQPCNANAGAAVNNVCAGATVTLGGTPAATGDGPFTYSWSPATGLSATNVANPVLTVPATNTTYTLTITASNGCTSTSTVAVSVLPSPNADLVSTGPEQVSTFNGLTTFSICDPGNSWTFAFQDASTDVPGATRTLNWGDGSPVENPPAGWSLTHTYPPGLRTLTYTVTYPNGCTRTRSYQVFLGTNPGGGISTDPNTSICTGGSLPFFINSVSGNSPGTTYIINFGDGNSITLDHPPPAVVNHTYDISSCGVSGGQYTVSFTAQNPCDQTQGQIGPIRVSQTPEAQFTLSPNDTACVNTVVTFTDQSIGLQAPQCQAPRRVWSISPTTGWVISSGTLGSTNGQPTNTGLWTNGSQTLGVQFTVPGTYTVTDLTGNACGIDQLSRTICVEAPPQPAMTLSPSVGCAPLLVATDNTSISPDACLTRYQWSVTGSGSSCGTGGAWNFAGGTSATSFEPQVQFTQPGNYTVQLQAINSCGTFTRTEPVVVNAPPQVTVAPLSGICASQCVSPSATVQPCGAPIDTYAWSFPGGSPASANTASPGQVCFPAPGSTTVSLTVTNACGSATSSANLAIGTLPPVPVVSSNSPVCQGQTLSLTAAFVPGVTYSWTGPNGFSSNQPSVTINNVTNANAGTYTVVAISGGCAGPPATVDVAVVMAPSVMVTPAATAICAGQSATLTANGAGNYQWFIGGNLVGTGPSFTTSPAVTTTYTVTGSMGGCPGSATVTVTVFPLPVVNAGTAQVLCDQAIPVTLSGSPAGGTWSGPIVTPGGVFTPIPDSLGVFDLTYTYTNNNGCTNTANVDVTVQPVTVFANAGPDTAFCPGTTPVLLPHAPPGGTWVGAGPGGSFVPSTVGSYTLTYTVGTGTCVTSDQVQVQVLPAPVVTVPPAQSVCADAAPVPLPATPVGGTWTGPGLSGTPATFDPSSVPSGPAQLTYSYSDGSGCTASGQTTITVNPLPVVNAGPDLVLCDQPLPVDLAASPTGGVWTSTWMNVSPTGTLTPDGLGTDTLVYTVVTAEGCTGSDTALVEVVPVDEPAIAGPDTAVCVNSGVVQLVGTPAGGAWSGTGVTTDGAFTPSAPGSYVLTYSVGSATCLTVDQLTVVVNALPVVDAGNDISVCLDGGPQVLSATPAGGVWSGVGVDPLSGGFDPASALPGGNPVTYSYTDPVTGCSDTDNALVTVNPLPVAGFVHGPVACVGAPFSFTNTSTGASSFQWNFGDGNTSAAADPAHVFAAPGTYTVTLTAGTGAGCTDSFTSSVEVWGLPTAAVSLSTGQGCGPLEVAFTNGSSGQGLQYAWDLGGLSTSTEADPAPFTFPPDPFASVTYTVTVTSTNVCGSATASAPVTVLPSPTAAFGPNVNVHCSYADVPFGNDSYGEPDSFFWDFGDGATSTLPGPEVTHAYVAGTEPTPFTITLVASNACGSDTAQATITVVPNEVTAFFNTDPVQGCAPLTVQMTQFSVGDSTWVWDLGDGNTSLVYEPTHTYTQPGTYLIELFSYGCGFDTYSTTVTVFPAPEPAFTTAPASVCVNEPFTFVDQTPGVTGVQWDLGDGTTSTLSTFTHSYAQSGTYPVTLTATSALNGCTASITQNVTVLVTPVAAFTPQPASGCIDLEVFFQNESTDATFFSWDFGNGNTSASAAPTHTYTVAGSYPVTLVAENLNGCSDTVTLTVVAHPLPVSTFTLSSYQSCEAPVTVLTSNTSQGAVGYQWDFGNGQTSELNQPSVTYTAPGTYLVQLTATNQFGCQDVSTATFVVHPTPVADFTAAPRPSCAGAPVEFSNSTQFGVTYWWDLGDGNESVAVAPVHVYDQPGLYDVTLVVTGAGGCTDTLVVPGAVLIHPSPLADFRADTLASVRNALQFTNLSQGATTYAWDFGDGISSTQVNPTHLFPGDGGVYTVCLSIVNVFGCPDTLCRPVGVNADPEVFVPNTFTPNGDGLNDVFLPVLNGFVGWNYRLLIFDRWGEIIHETRDANTGWNGKARGREAQIDVYVWKLVLERDGDARDFVGHVSLVR